MSSSLIHVSASPPSFRWNNIPLCVYTALFNQSSMGCFYPLALVNDDSVNMVVQISFPVPASNPFGIYPEVELLDQMVVPCLIFLRNCHTLFHGSCTVLHFY